MTACAWAPSAFPGRHARLREEAGSWIGFPCRARRALEGPGIPTPGPQPHPLGPGPGPWAGPWLLCGSGCPVCKMGSSCRLMGSGWGREGGPGPGELRNVSWLSSQGPGLCGRLRQQHLCGLRPARAPGAAPPGRREALPPQLLQVGPVRACVCARALARVCVCANVCAHEHVCACACVRACVLVCEHVGACAYT